MILIWTLLQLVPASRMLWRRISWARLWAIAVWLVGAARDRLRKNLTERERKELLDLMRNSKGRPGNLTKKEQERFRNLVRKAAVGERK
jgi:hypothetical protein